MKKVSPAIIPALGEAMATIHWFKKGLRSFLVVVLQNDPLVSQLDWSETKRVTVDQLLTTMFRRQDIYFDRIVDLTLSVADIYDPFWLKQIEDGDAKYRNAVKALDRLRQVSGPLHQLRTVQDEDNRRQREKSAEAEAQRAIRKDLDTLRHLLLEITSQNAQERGFSFERLLNQLFQLLDITSRPSFRIEGEQIDGAFSLGGHDFLVEAKWTNELVGVADLDTFAGKISRKLDNTLGLLISMNGFQSTAISTYSQKRSTIILMNGADLNAVLESRVGLTELLERKRRHASQTGEIFFSVMSMLTG